MSRIDLHGLINATASPERQMQTIRMPALKRPVQIVPARADLRGGGDVTLIGVICAISMTVCGSLAWLG